MAWLLLLHIAALICWCGSLLYLPALIVTMADRNQEGEPHLLFVARRVFTLFSTPAALLAIISGTAIFLLDHTAEVWLVAKLSLVGGLVVCHVFAGRLTLSVEELGRRHERIVGTVLSGFTLAFIAGILWLVLAKPF